MGSQVTVDLTLPILSKEDDGKQGYVSAVQRLQTMLNLWLDVAEPGGTPIPLVTDGVFGPATEHGVKLFQGNNNLSQDGIVGKQTWTTLVQRWLTQSGPE